MATDLTLVIGNKNYSSWSMRPWIALRGAGIEFRERMLKFESQDWRDHIGRLAPSGTVPVLWEDEPGSGFATWETTPSSSARMSSIHRQGFGPPTRRRSPSGARSAA